MAEGLESDMANRRGAYLEDIDDGGGKTTMQSNLCLILRRDFGGKTTRQHCLPPDATAIAPELTKIPEFNMTW